MSMVQQDSLGLEIVHAYPDPQEGAAILDLMRRPLPRVMAIDAWASNAELIVDIARVGYLRPDWPTLDATFGRGVFWKLWRPDTLVASDLNPAKSPTGTSVDATNLPHPDGSFRCVVIDGPYKLNGQADPDIDERYGVDDEATWPERMDLLQRMLTEGARVLGRGYLLFKCQNQVCSGKVRWQTDVFTKFAWEKLGLGKVDQFDILSYRPQKHTTSQVHARHNSSSMLVFRRGWDTTR